MRKGIRFTPARLEKWRAAGRGTGTGSEYQPWHQVTRSDPGSRGRSHLIYWRFGRLHHFLSDQELVAFGFASMLPNLVDLREQFPLVYDEHVVELASYSVDRLNQTTPGTSAIAEALGLRHPVVRAGGVTLPWVMSTDILLTLSMPNGRQELLAISVKHDDELANVRTCELLQIERDYWRQQGVYWLLLTPKLYAPEVANTIRIAMPWTIGQPDVPAEWVDACSSIGQELNGMTLTLALALLSHRLNLAAGEAQRVLWQTIWSGRLPIDLCRNARSSAQIEVIPEELFWAQNPISARRTTCLP